MYLVDDRQAIVILQMKHLIWLSKAIYVGRKYCTNIFLYQSGLFFLAQATARHCRHVTNLDEYNANIGGTSTCFVFGGFFFGGGGDGGKTYFAKCAPFELNNALKLCGLNWVVSCEMMLF